VLKYVVLDPSARNSTEGHLGDAGFKVQGQPGAADKIRHRDYERRRYQFHELVHNASTPNFLPARQPNHSQRFNRSKAAGETVQVSPPVDFNNENQPH